ncbi:PPE domain-containing protein [Prescottella subtropica]|uniref:PPE domain-containing protein n=1 Tax=Prescottella subtropica TaxID=2545757 RepID=UPI0010F77787|nr:PPE domain-containing protein [Prescottella subtropica]
MTLGVTGVVWLPRGATVNSTTLTAGAGPVPLTAASPAWAALAESFTDAVATLTRVSEELRAAWEGVAADAALTRIAPFTTWAQQTAALAADTAVKASTEASAYTTAALTMPSLPEITAVKAAKTAAYTAGGAVNGSAAVAEAADRALDIRAGMVMETYEVASNIVATPATFTPPPPLTTGVSGAAPNGGDAVTARSLENDFRGDPVRTVAATAAAFAQNPAVTAAVSQAGSVATSVGHATSAAANLGGAVLGGIGASAPVLGGRSGAPAPAPATRSTAGRVVAAGGVLGSVAARAAGVGGGSAPGGAAGATPPGTADAASRPGIGTGPGAGTTAPTGPTTDVARVDAATGTRGTGPVGGAPIGAHRGATDSDETEHATPGYLRSFEHFEDGRTVIPSVIGGDPAWDGR